MQVNEKIKQRRIDLKMTDVEISKETSISIYEYYDLETYPEEIFEITQIFQIKELCKILNFDFFDLFDMKCSFCEEGINYSADYLLTREKLIRKRREVLHFSREELGDKISFKVKAIEEMENEPDFFEEWWLEPLRELCSVLDIPMQVLIGVKCHKCNR